MLSIGEKSFANFGNEFLKEFKFYFDEKNESPNIAEDVLDVNELDKDNIYSEISCYDCGKKNIEKKRV